MWGFGAAWVADEAKAQRESRNAITARGWSERTGTSGRGVDRDEFILRDLRVPLSRKFLLLFFTLSSTIRPFT
jgi:hypothetical protein